MDNRNAIAIVGMACRFPGAPDVETFWRNLRDGVESIRRFDDGELAAAGVDAATRRDPAYVPATGALDGIEMFDAAFFGMTPREAEITDPQQRLFLECAWSALEAGGYRAGRAGGRVGVFGGAGLSTYLIRNLLPRADILESVGELELLMANNKDFVPTRVAYKLDLNGPAVNANTACSTGLVNVHLACQSLLAFECDMALAGGVSVQVPQELGYLFQPDGILSPDGHCRPFDADAAGTVSGNGAGVVLLKRLDEALAAGDHIHAVILGTAINNDGSDKAGFTAPSVAGQADVIAQALAMADVAPDTIAMIEAHGTGTPVGDPMEIAALTQVFRATTSASGFCAVGSVKSNFGHLDEAAGIAGLIKAALAIEHGWIPPTLHFARANPAIDLDRSPFYVNKAQVAWPDNLAHPRRAGVSSFGLGGTNAHAVLEQAPPVDARDSAPGWRLLTLSAKSDTALDAAAARLAAALDSAPQASLDDVAFTLLEGRARFAHRRAIACRDTAEAIAALRGAAPSNAVSGESAASARNVVFMFPGMGAQYVGMAHGLYEAEPVFRAAMDRSAAILEPLIGRDIRQVIFEDGDALGRVRFTQPALFVVEHAAAMLWRSWGVEPSALVGHSVGEYVAACLAGVFSLEDGLRLIAERGAVMEAAGDGRMLAVALDETALTSRLGGDVDLAVVSGPGMCVVAGTIDGVAAFRARMEAEKVECRDVPGDVATHSRMMDAPAARLRSAFEGIRLSPPSMRFVSCVSGTWITEADATSPDYWARHLRATVRLADAIAEVCQAFTDACFLEVGPGRTLSSPVLRHPARGERPVIASMRHVSDAIDDALAARLALGRLWVAGATLDPVTLSGGRALRRVPLPSYPFERKRFWIDPEPASGAARHRRSSNPADWLYLPSWRRSLAPSAAPLPGRAVVLGEGALAAACARQLREEGRDVALVSAGDHDWHGAGAVIDLRAFEDADVGAAATFARAAALGVAVARAVPAGDVAITMVTRGTADVAGHEALDPEASSILGAATAIEQEHPNVRCRVIDVEAVDEEDVLRRLATRIVRESGITGAERLVALRGVHRWCRDYVAAPPVDAAPPLREKGVYLITGAMGDVGRVIAAYLAGACRARLVLTSRGRALDDDTRRAIEAAGGEAHVRHADVASEDGMRALVDDVIARFGRIDGVVHAAGVTSPDLVLRPLAETTPAQISALFQPKVEGTLVLEHVLRAVPLDFCLLISSNASTLGGLGLGAYAAANHVVDAIAARARRDGRPWISTNWDGWPSAAAGADSGRTAIEQFTMTRAEAEAALALVLACDTGRVVVSAGDLHARLERWLGAADAPVVTAPVSSIAGLTAIESTVADVMHGLLGVPPVSARDSFFDLGGDSLVGSRLMARLGRRFGVELSLRLLFEDPTVAGIATQIARAGASPAATAIARVPDAPHYELSAAQRRLWILQQVDPGSAAYHVPLHQRLEGALDVAALEAALNRLVDRHESLRTTFAIIDGEPRQVVHAHADARLDQRDLSTSEDPEAAAAEAAIEHARVPFDLEAGPLVRMALLRLAAERHVLLFTMHHIISDGVSIEVIGRDLAAFYSGRDRAPLSIQYRDFAAWQNDRLAGPEGDAHRTYWHRQLASTLPVLNLIEDLPRPAVLTSRGRELMFEISAELTAALTDAGRRHHASLFMVLQAALKALLHRLTDQDDIIIGSPSAGRAHADLDEQVGFFLNTLPLRDRVMPGMTFDALVQQVARTVNDAFEHQEYPFEQLVTELQTTRDTSRSPIFDVMLILQNDVDGLVPFEGIRTAPFFEHNGTSKLDLSFNFKRRGAGLLLGIEYNTDIYLEDRIRVMASHFLELLSSAAAAPETPIARLAMMPADERRRVLETFNETAVPYDRDAAVIALFERRVAERPGAVAAWHAGRSLTYAKLDARANRLARHLASRADLGPERTAVIALPSGFDLLAALLAVLKLGGAAALVEPSTPAARLDFMLDESRASVLVATGRPDGLTWPGSVVEVTRERDVIEAASGDALSPPPRTPGDSVLIFFTSGSTGRPKAVPLSNRGIVNELDWFRRYFDMTPDDVLPQKTVLSFVDSVVELLLPITMTGGAVHLRPDFDISGDFARLADWFGTCGATILQFVPAVFEEFAADVPPASLSTLRALILSGGVVTRHPSYPFRVHNLYGCSECTSLSTWFDMTEPSPLCRVPIGKPLQNTRIYILDGAMQPSPLFVPGEIYIGGDMVAAGYLHNPAMSAERFIADPFSPGERLFRTGDFARWFPDGNIDYLGRRDDQVKIRGLRIECGEVEHTLREHEDVRDAVVVGRTATNGEAILAAYVIAGNTSAAELRSHLARTLPAYMIPAAFVFLDAYPRTSSGKIDKKALPAPELVPADSAPYAPPVTATEIAVAGIWQDVLGVARVGLHDDFLALGGHSLKATRVASRISRDLGLGVTLVDVFRHPTVAELAAAAEAAPRAASTRITAIDEAPIAPLSADELEFLK